MGAWASAWGCRWGICRHGEAAGSGSRTAPEPTTSGLAVRRKLGKDEWTRMVPLQNCSFHTFTRQDNIKPETTGPERWIVAVPLLDQCNGWKLLRWFDTIPSVTIQIYNSSTQAAWPKKCDIILPKKQCMYDSPINFTVLTSFRPKYSFCIFSPLQP